MSIFNDEVSVINRKIRKIVWFNSHDEWFNYLIVKGSKQNLDMGPQDLMILQHLLIKVGVENGYKMYWVANTKYFMDAVKSALGWANNKQRALIFKYRPTEEEKDANKKFEECKALYLLYKDDSSYNKMLDAFRNFYNLI